jgi:hypothetical protein
VVVGAATAAGTPLTLTIGTPPSGGWVVGTVYQIGLQVQVGGASQTGTLTIRIVNR